MRALVAATFAARIEEDATLFAAIRRRRREAASHRRKTPFFYVSFDEDEARLSKVNMDSAGSVGTNGGKEVVGFQPVGYILELFAVACEEDGSCSRSISNADNVALYIGWSVGGSIERLIISSMATRRVCNGILMPPYQKSLIIAYIHMRYDLPGSRNNG